MQQSPLTILPPPLPRGDLIVRNSTGNTKLAVGSDKRVLMADSTASTGVKWGVYSFYDLYEVTSSNVDLNGVIADLKTFGIGADDIISFDQTPTNPYASTMQINRSANYTGGQAGWVNSALRINSAAAASTTSYEWTLCSVMYNSGPGQNVGIYGQGNRMATTALTTWAATLEARDHTETDSGSLVGVEVDVFANGANPNNNRIGVDVIAGKGVSTGAACEAYAGLRIASVFFSTDGYYRHGISVGDVNQTALNATYGITIKTNGTAGVIDHGTKNVGMYASGSYSESAYRMSTGSWFAFDDTNQIKMRYNAANNCIEFYNGSTRVATINMAGPDHAL